MSLADDEALPNNDSYAYWSAVSSDGRYVTFSSYASNLVPGDTNNQLDIFVRDRVAGTTERVTVATDGTQSNSFSEFSGISADGRYAVFDSMASNLVPNDTNGGLDVFLRDLVHSTTQRISVASDGTQGNGESYFPTITPNGRFVLFSSSATTLTAQASAGAFVYDTALETISMVSVTAGGMGFDAHGADISPDGRYVVLGTGFPAVPGDTNGQADVYVRDLVSGTYDRASVGSGGVQANGFSFSSVVSADGRFVLFSSNASNLAGAPPFAQYDVYVRDRATDTTERVSVSPEGAGSNNISYATDISADGSDLLFESYASNLIVGDTNGLRDAFVRDRLTGITERVSIGWDDAQLSDESAPGNLSVNGRHVTFSTDATGVVPGDSDLADDVFLRDRCSDASCDPADDDADGLDDVDDNCQYLHNVAQDDNDEVGGPFGGFQAWIADGVAPEGIETRIGGDDCDVNDDNDLRCSDAEESGPNLALGGMRDPLNPWDFADVPTPALPAGARNGAVALTDVGAALVWVGTTNNGGLNVNGRDYDNDDNANGVEDGAEYDRTPNGQISGPPNGAVSLSDVGVILNQVGDSCIAAPN